jgi:hypothetical protein
VKPHWVVAVVALLAFAGWGVFASRSNAPDPLYSRDHLVDGDALVVTFKSDLTDEAYRFVSLKGKGWIWTRTTANATGIDGTLLFNGKQYMLEVSNACFVPLPSVEEPFIPGLTAVQKLGSARYGHNPDGSYTYETPAEPLISYAQPGATVSVTEQLSQLEHADSYALTTTGKTPWLGYGSYHLGRASNADRDAAAALLDRAKASKTADVQIRERMIWGNVGSLLQGPFDLLYADDCPATPVQLRPSILGGDIGGVRATAPDVLFKAGLTVDAGLAIPLPIFATRDELFDASEDQPFGPAQAQMGTVLVIPNNGATMAIQVTACTSSAAFHC